MKKPKLVRVDAIREAGKTDAYSILGCIQQFCREGVCEG